MRVLFSVLPGFGHFHPLVPAALALRAAGHQVAFATAERFCRNVVEPAGFPAFPAGLSPLQAAHLDEVAVARRLRPVPFDTTTADRLPAWVGELGGAPTVYVTLGTVFNTTPGLFETILAALAGEPVDVVVTVGLDRDPAQLGAHAGNAGNVHVERYLPQSLLLPHCDAVVAHGGSGTTLAALAHGLPSLLLPQGADQLSNARRVAGAGAGTLLPRSDVTPDAVRAAVRSLLSEPGYRVGARRLQQEIAQLPGPERGVELLDELAGRS